MVQDLDIGDKWDDYDVYHVHIKSSMLGAAVNSQSHAYAYWVGLVGNWSPYSGVSTAFTSPSFHLKNLNYEDFTFDSDQSDVSKINHIMGNKDHPVLSVGIGATCEGSQCSVVWLRSLTTSIELRKK